MFYSVNQQIFIPQAWSLSPTALLPTLIITWVSIFDHWENGSTDTDLYPRDRSVLPENFFSFTSPCILLPNRNELLCAITERYVRENSSSAVELFSDERKVDLISQRCSVMIECVIMQSLEVIFRRPFYHPFVRNNDHYLATTLGVCLRPVANCRTHHRTNREKLCIELLQIPGKMGVLLSTIERTFWNAYHQSIHIWKIFKEKFGKINDSTVNLWPGVSNATWVLPWWVSRRDCNGRSDLFRRTFGARSFSNWNLLCLSPSFVIFSPIDSSGQIFCRSLFQRSESWHRWKESIKFFMRT